MSMKKLLCCVLALVLCGAMAFAEGDVQAQLDAANARIAELEAEVEKYLPYYEAQVVAEYDGGVIFLEDAMAEYQQYADMYAQYGIDLEQVGYAQEYKQMAVQALVQEVALDAKAAEMGLDQLSEDVMQGLTEEAQANYETYISSVLPHFQSEDTSEEEARAMAEEYLLSMGYTHEAILNGMVENYIGEQMYNSVTEGVTLSEEDLQAAYDAKVAEQESSFANDSTYNSNRNNGDLILWNPEGYRAVKHVLVKFTDEQMASYSDLASTRSALEDELAAAQAPEEPAAEGEEAEAPAEGEEPAAEVRPVEEIEADLAAVNADIDALYAELAPKAQEVIDKFNAGTAFADLIAEYNEDPGMTVEPTATNGYAVAANSTTWDPAFRDGAMSIEAVGGISEPVYGQNGIHIIYYESDIPAGAVALDEVREQLSDIALEDKLSKIYNDAVAEWIAALNPVFHYERMAG